MVAPALPLTFRVTLLQPDLRTSLAAEPSIKDPRSLSDATGLALDLLNRAPFLALQALPCAGILLMPFLLCEPSWWQT